MNMAMRKINGCCTIKAPFLSVFKKTERFFRQNPGSEKLLDILSLQEDRGSYEFFSDHFFCQLFPEWKKNCFAYYKSRGPKLKDILPERCIRKCDEIMVTTLRTLKQIAGGKF